MEIILFDKDYGLYEKDQVIGKDGHFITSPLVSKHFLIASQKILSEFLMRKRLVIF